MLFSLSCPFPSPCNRAALPQGALAPRRLLRIPQFGSSQQTTPDLLPSLRPLSVVSNLVILLICRQNSSVSQPANCVVRCCNEPCNTPFTRQIHAQAALAGRCHLKGIRSANGGGALTALAPPQPRAPPAASWGLLQPRHAGFGSRLAAPRLPQAAAAPLFAAAAAAAAHLLDVPAHRLAAAWHLAHS